MAIARKAFRRSADALGALGEVTIVAPVQEASAIGHALTLRRPLRLEAIDDRVFAVDGTPTDCVNIAVTQVFKGLPDLVVSGHQQGLESRRRRDLFGHGRRRARRGAARHSRDRRVAAADARRRTTSATRRARRRLLAERDAAAAAAAADVSQHQRAEGAAEGLSRHRAGQAQSRHVGRRAPRSARAARTSGSKKGRTTGSRTIDRTIRRCATATSRSRRCIPI